MCPGPYIRIFQLYVTLPCEMGFLDICDQDRIRAVVSERCTVRFLGLIDLSVDNVAAISNCANVYVYLKLHFPQISKAHFCMKEHRYINMDYISYVCFLVCIFGVSLCLNVCTNSHISMYDTSELCWKILLC